LADVDAVLPLVVHYVDHDPGEGQTRLGTASSLSLARLAE
jgi:hypothetical protein